jgi:2'-5' RNA ligase
LAFDFGVCQAHAAPYQADRMFFAALPEPGTARRIADYAATLRQVHHLRGRVRPTRLLHVSLAGVGAFARLPEPVVAAAAHAGARVRMAPFDVRFNRVMSFDGRLRPGQRRAIVLRCDRGEHEFRHLRRAIGVTMRSAHLIHRLHESFVPHITLLYDEESLPEAALPETIGWTVREFALVHSVVGRGRHIHLARWQLDG